MKHFYSPIVLLRLAKLLVPLSLIFLIGFHWGILQSIAWVGMFTEYSRTYSWNTALQKTLSGEAPCRLCKLVKEGKAQEKQESAIKVEVKLDHWVVNGPVHFDHLDRWSAAQFPDYQMLLCTRLNPPPSPPPRLS